MKVTEETWKLMNGMQKIHVDCCCDNKLRVDFYSIYG